MDQSDLDKLAKYSQPIDIKEAPVHHKLFLFGETKVGKTSTLGRLAEAWGKGIVVVADPGWVVLKEYQALLESGTLIVEFQGWGHLKVLTQALKEKAPGYDDIKWIALDPLSGMLEDFLDELMEGTSHSQRIQVQSKAGIPGIAAKGRMLELPVWQDYHMLKNYARPVIQDLARLPMHVCAITHVNLPDETAQTAKQRVVRPNMTDKIMTLTLRMFGMVGLMTVDRAGVRWIEFSQEANKKIGGARIRALDGKSLKVDEFVEFLKKVG